MIQQDHAVGDVFFQAVPCKLPLAPLAGDDRRYALILEPAEQPPQLRTQDHRIAKAAEQGLDGVQHDPFGTDGVDGVAQANEQPFQVVFARLLDLAAFDPHVVQGDFLLFDQGVQVESQRADVLRQFGGGFLERHEDARLVELRGSPDQEFHRQQGLSATGGPADQRRSSRWKPTPCDLV